MRKEIIKDPLISHEIEENYDQNLNPNSVSFKPKKVVNSTDNKNKCNK